MIALQCKSIRDFDHPKDEKEGASHEEQKPGNSSDNGPHGKKGEEDADPEGRTQCFRGFLTGVGFYAFYENVPGVRRWWSGLFRCAHGEDLFGEFLGASNL